MEIYEYEDEETGLGNPELAELTGIGLLQVDLYVRWGEPPREQSRRFSTVKALLANRLEGEEP